MTALDRFKASKAEAARHKAEIADVGLKVHRLRTGDELASGYSFHSHRRMIAREMFDEWFEGKDDDGFRTPVYPAGTPLIVMNFYHQRWNEGRDIAVPESYFADGFDYLAAEQKALDATAAELIDSQESARIEAERVQKQRDRETYERLRAQFEGETK